MADTSEILLVEDAADTQLIVRRLLGTVHQLTICSTAKAAIEAIQHKQFELIILDIGLPDDNGFSVCTQIRSHARYQLTPVIFLTGEDRTQEKVMAFALGADDYVVKPIVPAEFRARIESKLRRARETADGKNIFQKNGFRVLLSQQKILMSTVSSEVDLELSTIEFKLLYHFLRHEDHAMSRPQILREVWGEGTHVTERVVDTYIYSLRKKLGDRSASIESVPRIGYRYRPTKGAA